MTSDFTLFLMMLGVGIVAFLYSSVGHGGASGYLAILSLFSLMPRQMGTTALLLNCLVSGVAFITFFRAGHFSSRLTWPFLVASMPFAWIGGALSVSPPFYKMLLAFTLLVAAVRLSLQMSIKKVATYPHHPSLAIALPMGGGIGLLSGMVGVGGGIFLTPLLLLKGWADPKSASASSAFFILGNSIAALLGRFFSGTLSIGTLFPFMAIAFLGGLVGSHLGANHFSGLVLRRLLAIVLAISAFKLLAI